MSSQEPVLETPAGLEGEPRKVAEALTEQAAELAELVAPLSDTLFRRRPEPDRWSVGEHVVHLAKTARIYAAALETAIAQARTAGVKGPTRGRSTLIGGWFVRSMEPPPRMRVRTFQVLEPVDVPERDAAMAEYRRALDGVLRLLADSADVDLSQVRLRSPFVRLLPLRGLEAFQAVAAHERRHIWHVRRVLEAPTLAAEA